MTTHTTAMESALDTAALYGNRARVAIDFAIVTGNPAEALYAYLNTRWAARHALDAIARTEGGR